MTPKVIGWMFLLVSTVAGQYNYQRPQENTDGYLYRPPRDQPQPPNSYLPPTTTAAPPPYYSEAQVDAEPQNPPTDDTEHAPGMPYDFSYAVKDDYGNDFAHQADSDGEVVTGMYRTLLPDGRMQVVKYTADWKNGYNAEVSYEGEAAAPVVRPPTTQPPYMSDEENDSQAITPARRCERDTYDPECLPPTTQPPFRCYPGINDPRCPTTQPPFRCYPGINDPRCPTPPTTQPPFRCYPGINDPRCPTPPTTQPPFRCYPGIDDPRCPTPPTTQPPFRCSPGSYDPRCKPPPTAQPPFRCYPGIDDPRCPPPPPPPTTQPPRCYPGSFDTRCPPPPPPTTQPPPRCYPGSFDPRCPPATTYQPPTQPPPKPPGLYGAPSLPFGVRNNPKFGYNRK